MGFGRVVTQQLRREEVASETGERGFISTWAAATRCLTDARASEWRRKRPAGWRAVHPAGEEPVEKKAKSLTRPTGQR